MLAWRRNALPSKPNALDAAGKSFALWRTRGIARKDLKRPGVRAALEELEHRRADGLVVAKLDRLSRSMLDFTAVMAKAQKEGWALVALDCAFDTTTPAGEAMAARASHLRAVRP